MTRDGWPTLAVALMAGAEGLERIKQALEAAAGDWPAGNPRRRLLAAARYLETAADALTDSAGELRAVEPPEPPDLPSRCCAACAPEPICGLDGHECQWCAAYREAEERR